MIGIYDSGVGGLSIWRELRRHLNTRLIYFGDTAHVPYGEKNGGRVRRLLLGDYKFFFQSRGGCSGAVVACNTTSTLVLPKIRDKVGLPVLGIVEGALEATLAAGGAAALVFWPPKPRWKVGGSINVRCWRRAPIGACMLKARRA